MGLRSISHGSGAIAVREVHCESLTGRESNPLARSERFQFITSSSPGLVLAQADFVTSFHLR